MQRSHVGQTWPWVVQMERTIGEVSFLQGSQNLTCKEISVVFVICCSDLSLAKHKNNNSSYNSELATQLLEKLLSWNPITLPTITLNTCALHLQVWRVITQQCFNCSLQILLTALSRSAGAKEKYRSHSNYSFGCYGNAFMKVHGFYNNS